MVKSERDPMAERCEQLASLRNAYNAFSAHESELSQAAVMFRGELMEAARKLTSKTRAAVSEKSPSGRERPNGGFPPLRALTYLVMASDDLTPLRDLPEFHKLLERLKAK